MSPVRQAFRAALGTLVFLLFAIAPLTAISAYATGNSHPDCHGSNSELCRPDPQPDHGRDCERSDDHICLPPSTTNTTNSPPATTTSTAVSVPTTATTAPPSTVVVTSAPTVPTAAISPSLFPVSIKCLTPDGYPYQTSYPNCPEPHSTIGQVLSATIPPLTELPRTGSTTLLLLFGFILSVSGLAVFYAGKII